jgi:hypothetical protein
MKYALISLILILFSTSCKSNQDHSIQFARGRMYGQLMRSFAAVSFDPKVLEVVPASSQFNELLSRFWFQGFGINPTDALPETLDGKSIVAFKNWTNRFGKEFLAGYRMGWQEGREDDIAKMGYAAGWLHADQGYDRGRDQKIGLMGLDLVTEVAVVSKGLARNQVSPVETISDKLKRTFTQNYNVGHVDRIANSAPRGDWVRIEVGLPNR